MICPKCGSSNIKRSARHGVAEGVLLRMVGRAPFRCQSCKRRFTEKFIGSKFRRVGGRSNLACFLGLRRGQRRKMRMVMASAVLLVALIFFLFVFTKIMPSPVPRPYDVDPDTIPYRR